MNEVELAANIEMEDADGVFYHVHLNDGTW